MKKTWFYMFRKYLVFNIAFIFILINSTFGKIEIIKDSRGTDFWLTFLPNYHNNWSSLEPKRKYGDSLYIFISAEEPTKGSIEYFNRDGQQFIKYFEIIDPQDVYVFSVPSYDFALLGYNVSGVLYDISNSQIQTETVALNSFHVVSEKKVSVYGLSQAVTTSDAFMVLPTNILGNRYFILSYPSDGIIYSLYKGQSTPSQFAIVASEDNTQITIYPKAETYRYGRQVQNITLNKGEVYLVQAKINSHNLNSDLTGTEIIASKPIAVFSGHQRATVPVSSRSLGNDKPSRDILIEQMPPVSTWGKNSIVVPFAKSQREITYGNSLFRILAAEDDTEVLIDGVKVATLSQGSFYEGILDRPHYIFANKPILVGAFKKTCGRDNDNLGDPFLTIMPPVEQYLEEYRIINVQVYEPGNLKVYLEQFITVILPRQSFESFRIDGLPLSKNDFFDVPGGQYVYANIKVSDGVHYLKADTGFGIVIYGYGIANSYGYIGGCNYLRLNYLEPQITTINTDSCFISKGIAYKRRSKDAPLSNFIVIDTQLFNCELYFYLNKKDTIFFGFKLNDKYQDGKYAVYVTDTMNLNSQVLEEWIPGFTLAIHGSKPGDIQFVNNEICTGKEFCFNVPISNFGFLPKELKGLYFKNLKIFPKNFQPTVIQPGEKLEFEFCFSFKNDTLIVDTLIIEDACSSEPALLLSVKFTKDNEVPKVLAVKDSCLKRVELKIIEELKTDAGLQSVLILEQKNCNVNLYSNYPQDVRVEFTVLNNYEDSYFGIVAIDSAGNRVEYWDTIPGFTLAVDPNLSMPYDVGNRFVGSFFCDNFVFFNSGNFPVHIHRAYFEKNLDFNLIPISFPIVVEPKETTFIRFCINPSSIGLITDTLVIENYQHCIVWRFPFVAVGKEVQIQSQSKCDVVVFGKSTRQRNRSNHTNVFPNPAQNVLYVEPSKKLFGPTEIYITDLYGNNILNVCLNIETDMLIEIDVSKIPCGLFFLVVRNQHFGSEFLKFEKY